MLTARDPRGPVLDASFAVAYSPLQMRTRPTRAIICQDAIAHNLAQIRKAAPHSQVMAILKADAYGHGMVQIAQQLVGLGVDAFAVAYLEEGVALRQEGICAPILVLGAVVDYQIDAFIRHDLQLTASSLYKARCISRAAQQNGRKARVHIKVDSGMRRIGVRMSNALDFIAQTTELPGIEIVGVFSHLVDAEDASHRVSSVQLQEFLQLKEALAARGLCPPFHLANSAGIFCLPTAAFDIVRPGIALYGVPPGPELASLPLRPALSIHTEVSYVKGIRKDVAVGYGHNWRAPQDGWLATLPVGYADGYPRALSNRAEVLIGGRPHRVVGNISMDQCTVWLGQHRCEVGAPCVLMGSQGECSISAWDLAKHANTIAYEILCGWSGRVPRSYQGPAPQDQFHDAKDTQHDR